MSRVVSPNILSSERTPDHTEVDASALRAIAQAAVEVELFTIPLYMATLYSIQGMHQITSKGNSLYKNRWWPGPATTANPSTPNEVAFNSIFSVFIDEMLHLQMAANIATVVGVTPRFTGAPMQVDGAWVCYGPNETTIPHIADLTKTIDFKGVKVDLAEFSKDQLQLFKAIELPQPQAWAQIAPYAAESDTYHPSVPFDDWTDDPATHKLPMFGTIGHMYQCYYDYMNIRYVGGKSLWDHVFTRGRVQQDMFNYVEDKVDGHQREYPGFDSTLGDYGTDLVDYETVKANAYVKVEAMMDAITDQGEGSGLDKTDRLQLAAVQDIYRPNESALENNYARYTDKGKLTKSGDATARFGNGGEDHYDRFVALEKPGFVEKVITWPTWLKDHGPWTAADLEKVTDGPPEDGTPKTFPLPPAAAVAAAMNRMSQNDAMYSIISTAAAGAIAGVTTVLDRYWADPKEPFPYPSMSGSGDRMAICWALFGKAPNLAPNVTLPAEDSGETTVLLHACQGLDLDRPGVDCAALEIFHTCRTSNGCKVQGGCGFVQNTTDRRGTNVDPDLRFSAPGDNKCSGWGGCAVPISASQLFPRDGKMSLFDFDEERKPKPLDGTLDFHLGDNVHNVAYEAYRAVLAQRADSPVLPADGPPEPNDLRLVFPPST